jgi:DDE superfamily endonuclease
LQDEYIRILTLFACHFTPQVWPHAQVLVTGALLARGQRTVTSVLRVMGLSDETRFTTYHRVLNRAVWSARSVSQTLLRLLINTFVPHDDIVIGGDETIERRRGDKITAKGIYRDPVKSSHSHFVKASGLRWVTLMLLTWVPFAEHVWALPFLTLLAPSERFYKRKPRAHKTLTDWMRQALLQFRRWLPERTLIFVGDSNYAVLELLARMTQLKRPITMVTRCRMDAALYEPLTPRLPGQRGRPRKKGQRKPTMLRIAADPTTHWSSHTVGYWYGERQRRIEIISDTAVWYHSGKPAVPIRWVVIRDPLGKFKTQALLCTDLNASPIQIVAWFIQRWQLEVTHRDVREHLGVETQRQWSDEAIARTTPVLLGLYSLITLLAHHLARRGKVIARQSAWYAKPVPTFSDAIAAVRYELWRCPRFHLSRLNRHIAKLPKAIFNRFAEALCYST